MRRLTTAAALALALAAGAPALAQDQQTMDAAMTGMAQLGIDTEGLVLTEEQALQVLAIINEGSEEETEKVSQIEAILGR